MFNMIFTRDAVLPLGATDGPPTMMSFKAFLAAQDDSITVDDAIQKYNEYKLEFRRQQLNEFFVAHKDEEWYASFHFSCFFLYQMGWK